MNQAVRASGGIDQQFGTLAKKVGKCPGVDLGYPEMGETNGRRRVVGDQGLALPSQVRLPQYKSPAR